MLVYVYRDRLYGCYAIKCCCVSTWWGANVQLYVPRCHPLTEYLRSAPSTTATLPPTFPFPRRM